MNPDHQSLTTAIRRTVGIAALHRLHRPVDEENAQASREIR